MNRILIIDDHEIVRDGIKKILNERNAGYVYGEVGSAAEAFKLVS